MESTFSRPDDNFESTSARSEHDLLTSDEPASTHEDALGATDRDDLDHDDLDHDDLDRDGVVHNGVVHDGVGHDSLDRDDVSTDSAASDTASDTAIGEVPASNGHAAKTPTVKNTATDDEGTPLFDSDEVTRFRDQWKDLQGTFVDSPKEAVQQADTLVAQIMDNLAATFADHKRTLEEQWSRGDAGDTEDLRLALRSYRSFFNQLLAV